MNKRIYKTVTAMEAAYAMHGMDFYKMARPVGGGRRDPMEPRRYAATWTGPDGKRGREEFCNLEHAESMLPELALARHNERQKATA